MLRNIYFLLFISLIHEILATSFVTWGSVLKLNHRKYGVKLHSHDIKYGSGSGQQSVTGTDTKDDVNSHWRIKTVPGVNVVRGEKIECGSKIILEHLATKRNLHSHHFQSPLSHNQEVSCFGDDGVGDTGDYWTLICSDDGWRRDGKVRFKHVDTSVYLSVTSNKFGRPIHGQHEIVGTSYSDDSSYWQAGNGMYVQPSEFLRKKLNDNLSAKDYVSHDHSEL